MLRYLRKKRNMSQ